ncbi:MAG TPA: aldo/keto reductase [Chloroflexota bacterium]|nr:aldo/keto reductase [Chloroflexota bacterium]
MNYGQIDGLDRPASRIVLGSMAIDLVDPELSCALLDRFLARGGNLVDTAHVYRGGNSERAIGEWLRRRKNREQVMILTKGAHHDRFGPRVNPREIAFDLGQSLERLGTTYIDLYVLHRDDPDVPVSTIVETLNEHMERGRMRAIGGSNWSHRRLEEANAYAREHNLVPFAVSSPNLSLAVPNEPMWKDCVSVNGDAEAVDWYRRHDLPLLSWSSQGGGFFTGRFSPDDTSNADMVRVYYNQGNWERLRRAEALGQELGYSPIQIALAWVLNQPDIVTFPLIGPKNVEELESSLDAADIELTPQQVRWLNLEADTRD